MCGKITAEIPIGAIIPSHELCSIWTYLHPNYATFERNYNFMNNNLTFCGTKLWRDQSILLIFCTVSCDLTSIGHSNGFRFKIYFGANKLHNHCFARLPNGCYDAMGQTQFQHIKFRNFIGNFCISWLAHANHVIKSWPSFTPTNEIKPTCLVGLPDSLWWLQGM